jgi:hypothetical protein
MIEGYSRAAGKHALEILLDVTNAFTTTKKDKISAILARNSSIFNVCSFAVEHGSKTLRKRRGCL